MKKYDYLIVGSGLFGSTFANLATNKGKKVLVLDKRNHIGGNIYTEKIEGINVHKYGAHIFHTNYKDVWEYINSFADFNNFINSPIAIINNEVYNMPFNMNTFSKIWNDVITPIDAKKRIEDERKQLKNKKPKNLEEQAISLVGKTIYEKLIKGYTEKQWHKDCKDLPPSLIKRIPVRFTYNNNYFDDKYQGIPIGGYTKIIEKMLKKSEVKLNTNFFDNVKYFKSLATKIIYTGPLDEYFNYCFGKLQWRSLKFVNKILNTDNYQANAVVNYTGHEVNYTRVIEHKHFEGIKSNKTVITYEYPLDYEEGLERYYPVNDDYNNFLARKYMNLAKKEEKVIFGGRLAEYKYYDMGDVIKAAFILFDKENK